MPIGMTACTTLPIGGQPCTIPAPPAAGIPGTGVAAGQFQILVLNLATSAVPIINGTSGWTSRAYVYSGGSLPYFRMYTRIVTGDPNAATQVSSADGYALVGWIASFDLAGLAYSVINATGNFAMPQVTLPSAGDALYLLTAIITDDRGSNSDPWPQFTDCQHIGGPADANLYADDNQTVSFQREVDLPAGQTPDHSSELVGPPYSQYFFMATLGFINPPPSAPTPNTPANNASVDATSTVRLGWVFNDPGDSQTAYSLQYRAGGAGSWTTVTGTTDLFRDFTTGTFTAGTQYEWQVQTTDTAGNVSPWSASSFFTAVNPPAAPTIATPTAGSTITGPTQLVTITTSVSLTQLQYHVYGDTSGSADPSKVIDPGQTLVGAQATAKQFTVQGLPNGQTVHVQARVFDGNLWSPWADASYPVAFTPPPIPLATVTEGAPNDAAMTIAWTAPTPTGGQPAIATVNVTASPDGGATVEWSQSGLAPNGSVTFWTPASGVDYQITVTGVAANGSTAATVIN